MFASTVFAYQLHKLVAEHLFSAILLIGSQIFRNSIEKPYLYALKDIKFLLFSEQECVVVLEKHLGNVHP